MKEKVNADKMRPIILFMRHVKFDIFIGNSVKTLLEK